MSPGAYFVSTWSPWVANTKRTAFVDIEETPNEGSASSIRRVDAPEYKLEGKPVKVNKLLELLAQRKRAPSAAAWWSDVNVVRLTICEERNNSQVISCWASVHPLQHQARRYRRHRAVPIHLK